MMSMRVQHERHTLWRAVDRMSICYKLDYRWQTRTLHTDACAQGPSSCRRSSGERAAATAWCIATRSPATTNTSSGWQAALSGLRYKRSAEHPTCLHQNPETGSTPALCGSGPCAAVGRRERLQRGGQRREPRCLIDHPLKP